jgi:hypothetical protein
MLRVDEILPNVNFDISNEIRLLGSLQLNHILIVIGGLVTVSNIIAG